MNNLAEVYRHQGRHAEAAEGHRTALAICRRVLGEHHPATATSYNNVASNLDDQGRHAEAAEGYRKALVLRRQVHGEDHADTAASYNNVAFNLNAQGRYAEAAEHYRQALKRHDLESAHRELMRCYARLGEVGQALRHYQTLADRLRDELKATPAPETQALYERLRRGETV